MKIAISGSHGVGKTTLVEKLAKKLELPIIGEVARKVAKESGFNTTKQIKQAKQIQKLMFQTGVFYNQLIEERNHPQGFVSDRSIFDSVAYSILYNLPIFITRDMYNRAIKHSRSYDVIAYCPIPEENIEDDGFRLVDSKSQQAIDKCVTSLLNSAECRVLELSQDRSKWEEGVLEYLQLVGTR